MVDFGSMTVKSEKNDREKLEKKLSLERENLEEKNFPYRGKNSKITENFPVREKVEKYREFP